MRITLPLLKPAILIALIFRTLDALRIFDLPYVLTQGSNGTTTLSLYAYQQLTQNRLIGPGSALSVLTFIIVMAVSLRVHPLCRRQPSNRWRRRHELTGSGTRRHPDAYQTRAQAGVGGRCRNQILLWIGVVATILFCLFPFYWIINTSLKTGAELSQGSLFPHHPSLDNYSSIFKNSDFTTALRTSLIDAGAATLIALTRSARSRLRAGAPAVPAKVPAPRDRAVDLDVPADRDRGAAVQAVDRHRPLQHVPRD